jgi:hypothetical protein
VRESERKELSYLIEWKGLIFSEKFLNNGCALGIMTCTGAASNISEISPDSREVLVFYRKRTNATIRKITTSFAVRFR